MTRIRFMNTYIDNLTMDETIVEIDHLIRANHNSYVVTPNTDIITKLEVNDKFRTIVNNADLILADGQPLIWISKWYKTPIKEKVSGSDLFPRICKLAAEKGYSIYLLGAAEGIADEAAKRLTEKYAGLIISGTFSPSFGFEKRPEEVSAIVDNIKKAHPSILVVGLGAPKQETFIYEHREEMGVPISFGLGATIDFEAGNIKRAPIWMREHGLEWLFRITQDPKRLMKRYLIDDMKIIPLFFKYAKK